ncbi:MAG TPA: hypothetical protein VK668_07840 [Mucilaginibacter sp.]|nr:hypothetical protein [Mucilaginibacter sp.]
MKITASILVMYFGLLMMQPFANMDMIGAKPAKACASNKCCENEKQHKGQSPVKHQGTCNADFCNPFVPCGLSIVYGAQKSVFVNPEFALSLIKKPTIKEDIISDYLSDCWRPPELLS